MITYNPGQGANFQTMPSTPGSGPLTNPNTPAHQRGQAVSQTMYNVSKQVVNFCKINRSINSIFQPRRSIPNQGGAGMQLYGAPNCDYEPPKNFQQNFGNPYDCPEVSCDWLRLSILTSHWSMLSILTSHWSSILTSHSQGFYNASLMSSAGYSQVADYRYTHIYVTRL